MRMVWIKGYSKLIDWVGILISVLLFAIGFFNVVLPLITRVSLMLIGGVGFITLLLRLMSYGRR